MDRRDVLKTAGGIGAAAIGGGAGIAALTGGAAAQVGEIDLGDVEITTDDGTITGFTVSPDVSVEYDGLDKEARNIYCQVYVYGPEHTEENFQGSILTAGTVGPGNNAVNVADEDSLDTHAGSYTYDFPALDVLAKSEWEASDFEETEEGETEPTEVTFLVKFGVRAVSGGTIDPPGEVNRKATMTVSVTNEAASSSAGAESDAELEGVNQENDDDQGEDE